MIKGCQKKIILLKDTGSDFFEEAYFVLKGDIAISEKDETDMVKAATKIISDSDFSKKSHKNKISSKIANFIIGVVCGILVCAIIFLFI